MRIIRAWDAYTRYLIFSSEASGEANRLSLGNLLPDKQFLTSKNISEASIASVSIPKLWMKRYYVSYNGLQYRVRFCIHSDCGFFDGEMRQADNAPFSQKKQEHSDQVCTPISNGF